MFKTLKKEYPLHLMMLPCIIILLVYSYIPMLGIVVAFQDYKPYIGFIKSDFVGFDNFINLFSTSGFRQALYNTVFISLMKIITGIVVPVVFALFAQ